MKYVSRVIKFLSVNNQTQVNTFEFFSCISNFELLMCWKIIPNLKSILLLNHTQILPRHSIYMAVDGQVCFYRQLFANPHKPLRPCGILGGIIKVALGYQVAPNVQKVRKQKRSLAQENTKDTLV